jgi:hypothetical protein
MRKGDVLSGKRGDHRKLSMARRAGEDNIAATKPGMG